MEHGMNDFIEAHKLCLKTVELLFVQFNEGENAVLHDSTFGRINVHIEFAGQKLELYTHTHTHTQTEQKHTCTNAQNKQMKRAAARLTSDRTPACGEPALQ